MNYYHLSWKRNHEVASAFALQEIKLDGELISRVEGRQSLPFDFELRKVKESNDGIIIDRQLAGLNDICLDYQPNNLAWPLMSEKLKSVIEKELLGNEAIDWLVCNVKTENAERRYYILRFNVLTDVLDIQKTMFVQGTDHIIKPVFSER